MSNGLPKYDFLYDNNTFPVSSISGLRDFNKNTMDPSSRTRAGSLQSFSKVVYGSSVYSSLIPKMLHKIVQPYIIRSVGTFLTGSNKLW